MLLYIWPCRRCEVEEYPMLPFLQRLRPFLFLLKVLRPTLCVSIDVKKVIVEQHA